MHFSSYVSVVHMLWPLARGHDQLTLWHLVIGCMPFLGSSVPTHPVSLQYTGVSSRSHSLPGSGLEAASKP